MRVFAILILIFLLFCFVLNDTWGFSPPASAKGEEQKTGSPRPQEEEISRLQEQIEEYEKQEVEKERIKRERKEREKQIREAKKRLDKLQKQKEKILKIAEARKAAEARKVTAQQRAKQQRAREKRFREAKEKEKQRKKIIKKHYVSGKDYYKEEKFIEALEEWNKVLALNPEHKVAKRIAKAEKELERISKEREMALEEVRAEEKPIVEKPPEAPPEKVITLPPEMKDYQVKIGDTLRIVSWGELDIHIRVRPDGKISVPILGEFKAKGKTLQELSENLSEEAKGKVVVILDKGPERTVTIFGEVIQQGSYDTFSLHEIIALAGGFSRYGSKRKVFIFREEEKLEIRTFPQDFALHYGDIVIVPKSRLAKYLTVLDTIRRSLLISISPFIPSPYD